MGRAVGELDKPSTSAALPHEMEALNQLLQGRWPRFGAGRSRAGSRRAAAVAANRSEADLSSLFDQELRRRQETNYETPNSTEDTRGASSRTICSSAFASWRAGRMRSIGSTGSGAESGPLEEAELKRQLERLTREQNELRQQAEQLARQHSAVRVNASSSGQQGGQSSSQDSAAAPRHLRRHAKRGHRDAPSGFRPGIGERRTCRRTAA